MTQPAPPTPQPGEMRSRWPSYCIKPGSCERNRACCYFGCKHPIGADVRAEIDAAIAARAALARASAPQGGV
ncbi:hypothetical protein [Roseomonas chloroacetimidivorans]|uniref:hypothetical protein n=1 Tax=Roseomonas chloroacetimidivorans TaxID=1766656 RepID=UPI003C766D05